ncbi:hypothetical protein AR158_c473L [Paramecium bursaria Chlorella virus AR158]|uniref:hypothetical protein n=1 Tax=Paramecium bursaria Chlorella virus AR158 TaxID=380598 RepID=UPI00015AA6F8|nr:hypothetical protein AR158_c473L [Paramecium bursaria Chlorella virus AR158]ABU44018.1 hypothetical protein AR158_c473L [Paramecium bursaria Chlorella virus AR158]
MNFECKSSSHVWCEVEKSTWLKTACIECEGECRYVARGIRTFEMLIRIYKCKIFTLTCLELFVGIEIKSTTFYYINVIETRAPLLVRNYLDIFNGFVELFHIDIHVGFVIRLTVGRRCIR